MPILFDIHQMLITIEELLFLPRQFRKSFRFVWRFRCPWRLCVSSSVSDWLWPLFTADAAVWRKHTLSCSLAASARLGLAAVRSQWHHPFFFQLPASFPSLSPLLSAPFILCSDRCFIVFIPISTPWCQAKRVSNLSDDWQDLSEQKERFRLMTDVK